MVPVAACLAVSDAAPAAQPAPPIPGVATIPPIAVTASRTEQSLLDLLADVTWIGPEEIARSGVDSLAQLLQRQPGTEIVTTGGPARRRVCSCAARTPTRRWSWSTACASPRRRRAPPRWRQFRCRRSTISRSCAGLRRACTGRTRSAASSRSSRAAALRVSAPTRRPAMARTTRPTSWPASAAAPIRCACSAQADARRSNGFNAIANPPESALRADRRRLQGGERQRQRNMDLCARPATGSPISAQPVECPVRRRRQLRQPHDHHPRKLAGHVEQSPDPVLDIAADGRQTAATIRYPRPPSATAPFLTNQHQYAWQNDFTLPQGLLTAAVERLEERVSTSPEFPVNARNTNSALAIYQLRADAQALQANLRVDDSDQYGSHTTGAIAYGYRLSSQWRVTASYGTAFKAPTFNDLYYPGFSNPNLVPETSRNVEGGVYGNGASGDTQWELQRDRMVQPRQQPDRVRMRCQFQLRAAKRRERHAEGRRVQRECCAGAQPRFTARSTCNRRATTRPACSCHDARFATARSASLSRPAR